MKEETRKTEDPRKEMIKAQKKFSSWAMTSAIIIAFACLILDEKAIAKGIVLGTLFSIINFVMLGRSIPMVLGRSVGKTRAIGLISILSRYALLAVPLIVGIKSDAFNFIAVVVGIFAIQIVTMVNYTIINRFFDS
jgi:hypothetical protein